MKLKNKKLTGYLILFIVFFSCERKFDETNFDVNLANLFSSYGNEIDNNIVFLKGKLDNKKYLLNLPSNSNIDSINSVIVNYYNYLNELDLKSSKLGKNIFYEDGVLLEDGKIFDQKNKKFLSDLDQLIKDVDLKDYLTHYFDVADVKNENDIYFIYMEYHFLGIPYSTFKFLIKQRMYNVIQFQNEVFNTFLIKNCK